MQFAARCDSAVSISTGYEDTLTREVTMKTHLPIRRIMAIVAVAAIVIVSRPLSLIAGL